MKNKNSPLRGFLFFMLRGLNIARTSHLVVTRLGLGTSSLPSKFAWVISLFLLKKLLTRTRAVALRL
jgi:hypothetical protein